MAPPKTAVLRRQVQELESNNISLLRENETLTNKINNWEKFFLDKKDKLEKELVKAISKDDVGADDKEADQGSRQCPWSTETTWTPNHFTSKWDWSSAEVVGQLFILIHHMIRQGDLDTHEHEFVAAINRLTQILSTTPQINEVAIRWLLDRCNGITVDVNGPTKMAIWALADIFHKRWYVVLPPAYLKVPFILAEALEIDRARQANDDRGAFALRVQVQPGEKTASFVKVSRLKYCVLLYLDDNEKKVAFVDWNLLPVTMGETIVRVEGPKRQFFELDLAQEEHLNFYSLCFSVEL